MYCVLCAVGEIAHDLETERRAVTQGLTVARAVVRKVRVASRFDVLLPSIYLP